MLTTEQLTTLKNYIASDPIMSIKPMNGDGDYDIANLFNQLATPDFYVWSPVVQVQNIYDAIVWANMTPAAPASPDATGLYRDRALTCQGKQFNLQTMLSGRETLNASKPNIRAGLQDALTALPSKSDGTNQSAGWAAVQLILSKKSTVFEKVLSTGTGTQANPATMGYYGHITQQDVNQARNS